MDGGFQALARGLSLHSRTGIKASQQDSIIVLMALMGG